MADFRVASVVPFGAGGKLSGMSMEPNPEIRTSWLARQRVRVEAHPVLWVLGFGFALFLAFPQAWEQFSDYKLYPTILAKARMVMNTQSISIWGVFVSVLFAALLVAGGWVLTVVFRAAGSAKRLKVSLDEAAKRGQQMSDELALAKQREAELADSLAYAEYLNDHQVTVFAHDSGDRAFATKVFELFKGAAWQVSAKRTNLPQHADGVRIIGGNEVNRSAAAWAMGQLGVVPIMDTEQEEHGLQVVIGKATPITLAEITKDADRLRADLGRVTGDLREARRVLGNVKWNCALSQLRWMAERAKLKGYAPTVTIRSTGYDDFELVEKIENIFKDYTQWPVTLDPSNKPLLRPSDENFKVVFALNDLSPLINVANIFDDGGLLPGVSVALRRTADAQTELQILIEVLPTRKEASNGTTI